MSGAGAEMDYAIKIETRRKVSQSWQSAATSVKEVDEQEAQIEEWRMRQDMGRRRRCRERERIDWP